MAHARRNLTERVPGGHAPYRPGAGKSRSAREDYQKALAARGIQCSMSRKGNCWDNAVAESFFSSLKIELVHDARTPCLTNPQVRNRTVTAFPSD